MLRKLLVVLIVLAGGAYLFRAPLWQVVQGIITADMYVATDADAFDPGVAADNEFPEIKALYQGRLLSSPAEFVADQGMIFVANRSAVW